METLLPSVPALFSLLTFHGDAMGEVTDTNRQTRRAPNHSLSRVVYILHNSELVACYDLLHHRRLMMLITQK